MLASCAAACVSCSRMVCPYQTIKYFVYSVLNKVWAFRWCGREGLWCKDWPCVDSSTKPCFIFRSSCHATCIVQLSSSPNSVATGHIEHCSITCLKKSRDTIIYVSIAIKKSNGGEKLLCPLPTHTSEARSRKTDSKAKYEPYVSHTNLNVIE